MEETFQSFISGTEPLAVASGLISVPRPLTVIPTRYRERFRIDPVATAPGTDLITAERELFSQPWRAANASDCCAVLYNWCLFQNKYSEKRF